MKILILGATGLVGRNTLAQALSHPTVKQVIASTRKPLPRNSKLTNPVSEQLELLLPEVITWGVDTAICALGTTIGRAGSKGFVEPEMRRLFKQAAPLRTRVIYCYDSRSLPGEADRFTTRPASKTLYARSTAKTYSTCLSWTIGLVAINISKAGSSLAITYAINPHAVFANSASGLTWEGVMLEAVPENIAKSIAENHILQVAVFAILLGIATARLEEGKKRPLLAFFESFTAAIFQLTNLIMYLAPLAVGAALAYAVARSRIGVLLSLVKLVLTLYAAIAAFALLGMFPAVWLARVPLRRFLAAISEPAAIAFATSTSEAALPVAMERMEGMGIPGKIVGFVIPLGYSFNLAGSCLYLSMAAVFLAQAGGIHISLGAALVMLWTMMLASKGIAGIPRAVFLVLAATAASFHLPLEVLPVLLGVDVLMDMGRSTVNAVGNCVASAVIARWENSTGYTLTAED